MWCAETARKSAEVWVVRPNATGRAEDAVEARADVERASLPASVPATTPFPCGHASAKTTSPCAGTLTHGPSTGMQRGMPLHSFAARGGPGHAATASAADEARRRSTTASHTSLLNHQADSAAPARMRTNAASVTPTVISRNCLLYTSREPSSL